MKTYPLMTINERINTKAVCLINCGIPCIEIMKDRLYTFSESAFNTCIRPHSMWLK